MEYELDLENLVTEANRSMNSNAAMTKARHKVKAQSSYFLLANVLHGTQRLEEGNEAD